MNISFQAHIQKQQLAYNIALLNAADAGVIEWRMSLWLILYIRVVAVCDNSRDLCSYNVVSAQIGHLKLRRRPLLLPSNLLSA